LNFNKKKFFSFLFFLSICSIEQINKEIYVLGNTNETLNRTLAKLDAEKFVDLFLIENKIQIVLEYH